MRCWFNLSWSAWYCLFASVPGVRYSPLGKFFLYDSSIPFWTSSNVFASPGNNCCTSASERPASFSFWCKSRLLNMSSMFFFVLSSCFFKSSASFSSKRTLASFCAPILFLKSDIVFENSCKAFAVFSLFGKNASPMIFFGIFTSFNWDA